MVKGSSRCSLRSAAGWHSSVWAADSERLLVGGDDTGATGQGAEVQLLLAAVSAASRKPSDALLNKTIKVATSALFWFCLLKACLDGEDLEQHYPQQQLLLVLISWTFATFVVSPLEA